MFAWADQNRLILEHRELAHRFALKYRLLLERDDLLASADVGLCVAARTWQPGRSDFIAYMHSKVMQTVVNEIRRERGRPDRPHAEVIVVPPEELAERHWYREDQDEILDLDRGLAKLTETQRRMICAVGAGYTLVEIGRAYGVSEGRISQITTAARRLLRVA